MDLTKIGWAAAAAGVAGFAVFWALTSPGQVRPDDLPDHEADPVAGQLIFNAGGCTSCHAAPGVSGDAKLVLAGGLEIHSDFGTFLVPNISPDMAEGIGAWTEAEFVTAMQDGVSPDGAHYYPAFPFTSYARMDQTDLLDLFAYMQTLPPSDVRSKPHQTGFPFNIRRGLGLWKLAFAGGGPDAPQDLTPLEERGRYLVEGPGHCGECHTPRNALGGPDYARWLEGGPNPDGPGRIPNITNSDDGLGDWSADDIASYLESGFTPEFDSVGGSMTAVVDNMAKLPATDRDAIGAYLKRITP